MNERLREVLSRIPFGAILFVFMAYLAFDLYSFTQSQDSPLIQKRGEIESTKKENQQIQVKLKQADDFFRSLEVKKGQLRELAVRLDEMKASVSEDLDVAGFIKMAVTEAKKVGLNVLSLKPTASTSKEFYVEQAFDMSFHGVYVQLLVFLERLANVQKIVRVDNFSIRPVSSSLSRYVELDGAVELKVYRYLASKADEIARQGAAARSAPPVGTVPASAPGNPGAPAEAGVTPTSMTAPAGGGR